MLATLGEDWKRQWLAQGRAEGRAEALVRLLERRFGPLPEARRREVLGADQAAVEVWLDRVLDARYLDELFDAHS